MVILRQRHNRVRVDEAARFRPTEGTIDDIEPFSGIDENGTVPVSCLCGALTVRIPAFRVGFEAPLCEEHDDGDEGPWWLEEAATLRANGWTYEAIGHQVAASRNKVHRELRRFGLHEKGKDPRVATAVALRESGATLQSIADTLGVKRHIVKDWLAKEKA